MKRPDKRRMSPCPRKEIDTSTYSGRFAVRLREFSRAEHKKCEVCNAPFGCEGKEELEKIEAEEGRDDDYDNVCYERRFSGYYD